MKNMEMPGKPIREARVRSRDGVKVEQAITLNRLFSTVYFFWWQLESLPLSMSHLMSVIVPPRIRQNHKKYDAAVPCERRR